jgi:hypothetical protein
VDDEFLDLEEAVQAEIPVGDLLRVEAVSGGGRLGGSEPQGRGLCKSENPKELY